MILIIYVVVGAVLLGIGHNIRGNWIRSLVGEIIACTGVWLIITAAGIGVSHYLLKNNKLVDQYLTIIAQMTFVSGYLAARVFGSMPRKL